VLIRSLGRDPASVRRPRRQVRNVLREPRRHRGFTPPTPPPTPDTAVEYRGWAQLGLVDEIREHGAVVVRRFGHDVVAWVDENDRVQARRVAEPVNPIDPTGPTGPTASFDEGGDADEAVPVVDLHGVALMYHWAPGDDRSSPPPPIPDTTDLLASLRDEGVHWTSYCVTFPTTVVGMAENSADRAHFATLHRTTVGHASPVGVEVRADGSMVVDTLMRVWTLPGVLSDSKVVMSYAGPFTCRTRFHNLGRRTDLLAFSGPTGDHTVEMLFVSISTANLGVVGRLFHQATARRGRLLLYEDRRVLSTRTLPEHPNLSDYDGPLLAVRRWMDGHRAPLEHRAGTRARVGATPIRTPALP